MNDVELSRYITDTFAGVDTVVDSGNTFFFYNPDTSLPPDHKFPFVTLVTNDAYDKFSDLNRPSVFRLNIGVSKNTFHSLFNQSEQPSDTTESDDDESSYDFTTLDQFMPHPEYGRMYWLCILSPSDSTLEAKVKPLLAEAYEMAVSKYDKKAARR